MLLPPGLLSSSSSIRTFAATNSARKRMGVHVWQDDVNTRQVFVWMIARLSSDCSLTTWSAAGPRHSLELASPWNQCEEAPLSGSTSSAAADRIQSLFTALVPSFWVTSGVSDTFLGNLSWFQNNYSRKLSFRNSKQQMDPRNGSNFQPTMLPWRKRIVYT